MPNLALLLYIINVGAKGKTRFVHWLISSLGAATFGNWIDSFEAQIDFTSFRFVISFLFCFVFHNTKVYTNKTERCFFPRSNRGRVKNFVNLTENTSCFLMCVFLLLFFLHLSPNRTANYFWFGSLAPLTLSLHPARYFAGVLCWILRMRFFHRLLIVYQSLNPIFRIV